MTSHTSSSTAYPRPANLAGALLVLALCTGCTTPFEPPKIFTMPTGGLEAAGRHGEYFGRLKRRGAAGAEGKDEQGASKVRGARIGGRRGCVARHGSVLPVCGMKVPGRKTGPGRQGYWLTVAEL